MAFLIWFAVFTVVLHLLGQVLKGWLDQPHLRMFLLPGYLVAMVSRFIACQISYSEIKQIKVLGGDRNPIDHKPSRIPTVGPVLLAGLPLLLMTAAWFTLDLQIGLPLDDVAMELPADLPFRLATLELLVDAGLDHGQLMWDMVSSNSFSLGSHALFLYLSICLLVAAAPLETELKPLLAALLVVILLARGAQWLGLSFAYLSNGWFLQAFYGDAAWEHFSLLVSFSIFLLGLAGALRLTVIAINLLRPRRDDDD